MRLEELKAYEILEDRQLKDLNSKGILLRHKKSGARISVISNDDENKVFYIGFRTPPKDSTGVPHIIEHSVLCGSDKYPVKDPFVELVKGSLNTFLNAMTYPDKTIYPVASCNEKDFQNLMDVYIDAVLHPNIYQHREIFEQEGWHYELEQEDGPVTINGVVYNEMKGAFSSPDDVLQREILNSLFPDTSYANESGGAPDCIPDLTYEEFLAFHRRYYHPSNSYIYLYGNMDVAEKLKWMDEAYLSAYDAIENDSQIRMQGPFDHASEVRKAYPVASGEDTSARTYLSYNLAVGTSLDKKLYQAFDILDYALLNAPGAPLKKALIDAGIGKDIIGGYSCDTLQPIFSVIAKNADSVQKDKFLTVVRETLEEQVKNGLNKKALLAGINSAEFRYREADYGQFPKGLLYGIQCLDSWLYDEKEPFLHLEAIETYRFLKEQVETGYFENLIQTYLLDNTHASVLVIEPERGLNVKREKELSQRLKKYKESLTAEQIRQLCADTRHLREYQEETSKREDLEKIPMLRREDMKKEAAPLVNEERDRNGVKILYHDIFTSGIDYLTLLFDIRDIAPEDYPYLGILKSLLGFMDTKSYSYADLANEINIHTGGISVSLGVYPKDQDMEVKYEVRTKVLAEKLPEAMRLVREILLSTKYADEKRLQEILAQLVSRLKVSLSSAGHSAAYMRAMSYFSRMFYYLDAVSGIRLYHRASVIEKEFEQNKEALVQKLTQLASKIFTAERLMVSITCEKKHLDAVEQEVESLCSFLYPGEKTAGNLPEIPFARKNEGFMDASQVQYVARTGNFIAHGHPYTGTLKILKVILGYDYLWNNVRVKGGAYGCMNGYMRNGDTYFVSYRDPNLSKTNEVFDRIPEYVGQFDADEREMTKYIIGTVSDLDAPLTPATKGIRSLSAYLSGITFADLQRERDEVIGASPEKIRALKPLLISVLEEENICVIGNEDTLKREKEMFMELKEL